MTMLRRFARTYWWLLPTAAALLIVHNARWHFGLDWEYVIGGGLIGLMVAVVESRAEDRRNRWANQ